MDKNQKKSLGIAERPHSIQIIFGIFASLASLAAVATFYNSCRTSAAQKTEMLSFLVLAGNAAGPPIVDAEVSLNVPELAPEHTDTKGQIFFRLPKNVIGLDGRISVRKPGFENFTQQILLQPRSNFFPVYLTKTSSGSAESMQAGPGSAIANGYQSPAISGSSNSVGYGAPASRKKNTAPDSRSTVSHLPAGSASSSGYESPAVSGNGNSVSYDSTESPHKKKSTDQ